MLKVKEILERNPQAIREAENRIWNSGAALADGQGSIEGAAIGTHQDLLGTHQVVLREPLSDLDMVMVQRGERDARGNELAKQSRPSIGPSPQQ